MDPTAFAISGLLVLVYAVFEVMDDIQRGLEAQTVQIDFEAGCCLHEGPADEVVGDEVEDDHLSGHLGGLEHKVVHADSCFEVGKAHFHTPASQEQSGNLISGFIQQGSGDDDVFGSEALLLKADSDVAHLELLRHLLPLLPGDVVGTARDRRPCPLDHLIIDAFG